jgi:uncharacterized membrane protein
VFNAIVLFIHIVAAAAFVGPQLLLIITVPSLRTLADAEARAPVTRTITRAFGWVGGIALAVLVVTGLVNFDNANDLGLIDREQFPRYFWALQIKLTLVTVVIVLTALHGAVLGRRLQRLQESGAPDAEVAAARRWSMAASMLTFVTSLALLLCAALLASDWSLR